MTHSIEVAAYLCSVTQRDQAIQQRMEGSFSHLDCKNTGIAESNKLLKWFCDS